MRQRGAETETEQRDPSQGDMAKAHGSEGLDKVIKELEIEGKELLEERPQVREEGQEGAEMRKIEGLGQRHQSGWA